MDEAYMRVRDVVLMYKGTHEHVQPIAWEEFDAYDLEDYTINFSIKGIDYKVTMSHLVRGHHEEWWVWSAYLDVPLAKLHGMTLSDMGKDRDKNRHTMAKILVRLAKSYLKDKGLYIEKPTLIPWPIQSEAAVIVK